jgi:hypothetical protein
MLHNKVPFLPVSFFIYKTFFRFLVITVSHSTVFTQAENYTESGDRYTYNPIGYIHRYGVCVCVLCRL